MPVSGRGRRSGRSHSLVDFRSALEPRPGSVSPFWGHGCFPGVTDAIG